MKIERLDIPSALSNIPSTQNKIDSNSSFSETLKGSIEKINSLQKQADAAINDLLVGNNKDIVQTMIMMEKADVAFRLMTQVRNKIVQAYEEIMRMQI
ncbi:flagellar hook-basal body complex protein FliE [Candidatus Gottesmanbacteria bacterium]|nr:flagellar hook-basal body complex protein FliE [Candidatus Gottesmanbacteria bacterium]